MKGEAGKKPPATCQPSPLSTTASYQVSGPLHGWWALNSRRVWPSADRLGATATPFEPESLGSGSFPVAIWAKTPSRP